MFQCWQSWINKHSYNNWTKFWMFLTARSLNVQMFPYKETANIIKSVIAAFNVSLALWGFWFFSLTLPINDATARGEQDGYRLGLTSSQYWVKWVLLQRAVTCNYSHSLDARLDHWVQQFNVGGSMKLHMNKPGGITWLLVHNHHRWCELCVYQLQYLLLFL